MTGAVSECSDCDLSHILELQDKEDLLREG